MKPADPVSPSTPATSAPTSSPMERGTFFRQTGWMTLAALLGGVGNMAANIVAQRMPEGQFNIFNTALSALGILGIPALGMQAAFAAQAAGADGAERSRDLASTMRGALGLLALVWVALAGWWFLREREIMAAYNLTQPAMLWTLLFILLLTLLTPVPLGTLQGRQDFAAYGWCVLLNGLGRFLVLFAVVRGLGGGALGGLIGVLAGAALVLGLVAWRTKSLLTGAKGQFDWKHWLQRLIPVTIGLGALSVITQADALAVRKYLQPVLTPDEADGYSAVRIIAQALVFVIGALTAVMFPKVARSFQRAEKTDVLRLTLALTAAVGVAGALAATLFPELPLRILSPGRLFASKTLVPAYCWAIVPVALASVMVWSLLARECYRVVPWLAALAAGYWLALQSFHDRLITVIGMVGAFGTLLCLVCGTFLWLDGRGAAAKTAAPANH